MEQVFIGIGTNLGDKVENIKWAIESLHEQVGKVIHTSSFYESEPWGYESSEWFVNAVIEIQTNLDPQSLLTELKNIEFSLGRTSKTSTKYEDRLIDLDILYFGDKSIFLNGLEVPHPRIYQRKFVLEPLYEIAPNFIDVKVNKSISELLNECTDTSVLKKIVF